MELSKLYLNALRIFNHKKLQLVAIGIIILLSSFIFTTMNYSITSIKQPTEQMFKEYHQEDFSIELVNQLTLADYDILGDFIPLTATHRLTDLYDIDPTTYQLVMKNRISQIESKLEDIDLALREFKDVNIVVLDQTLKVRFYKDSNYINKTYVESGTKVKTNNEMMLNKTLMKSNHLEIGDLITINGKNYTLTGNVLFPDITLPLFSEDLVFDNSTFGVGLVSNTTFDQLDGVFGFYISGLDVGNNNTLEQRLESLDDTNLTFVYNYTMTKNQLRSGAIYEEIRGGEAMSLMMSLMIASIAILVLTLIIYKIIKQQQTQIGLLKALGMDRMTITIPYIVVISLITLPMLFIGYFLGIYASKPLKDLYLFVYLLPDQPIKTNPLVFSIAIIIPFVFIVSITTFVILGILNKKPIDLLKSKEELRFSKFDLFIHRLLKRLKTINRFRITFILSNKKKFLIFFIGTFFSSFLIIMSLMMTNIFYDMSIKYYESTDYLYQGYISYDVPIDVYDHTYYEKFLSMENFKYNDDYIHVLGIDKNTKFHPFTNSKGEIITNQLEDGVIINESFKIKYNVKEGDLITVTLNNKKYKLSILGVADFYGEASVYMSLERLNDLIPDQSNDLLFNGVYSIQPLEKNLFSSVINKDELISQSKQMQKFMVYMVYTLVFTAIIVAVLVLYILSNLTIEENNYNITLLKVLGYTKKEVNKMLLNGYYIYSVLIYIISIPITVFTMKYLVSYLADMFNMILPFRYTHMHGVIGFISISIIYFIGVLSAKRKIGNTSLQESLKLYAD